MVGMSMQTQRGDSLGRHQIQDRRPIRNDLQRRECGSRKAERPQRHCGCLVLGTVLCGKMSQRHDNTLRAYKLGNIGDELMNNLNC